MFIEAPDRPATFDAYSQDRINGIVHNYADPPFHCSVQISPNPEGMLFPIIIVPGGHSVPVRARRSGPHGNIIEQNAIYIRKPGPRSETPQDSQEWAQLLDRCLVNRRDDMLNQIRNIFSGTVEQGRVPDEDQLINWIENCQNRWTFLIQDLPENSGARCPHGYHWFAYEINGVVQNFEPIEFAARIRRSVVRHTGWPPFWYPTRAGIEPYSYDGQIECWLGGDPDEREGDRDPAHSDFWRISPEARAFLLRGYQEDGLDGQRVGQQLVPPGTQFDITLQIWRVAEVFLHAESLSKKLIDGNGVLNFKVHYNGLANRALSSITGRHFIGGNNVAHQNDITLSTQVDTASIGPNLPEIIRPLLSPLYALFDFWELPMELVVAEISQMRSGRF